MRVAASLLLLILAGCGSSPPSHPAAKPDSNAVLKDASDNLRLDRQWPCGALRTAARQSHGRESLAPVEAALVEATGQTCDAALGHVHRGTTRAEVRLLIGEPDRAGKCSLFKWPPANESAVDGARICFARNAVSRVQIAVHG